jgi:hypothetical protein
LRLKAEKLRSMFASIMGPLSAKLRRHHSGEPHAAGGTSEMGHGDRARPRGLPVSRRPLLKAASESSDFAVTEHPGKVRANSSDDARTLLCSLPVVYYDLLGTSCGLMGTVNEHGSGVNASMEVVLR